ncbi:hypothetical protein ElyMa_006877400, partial [Elysia marginata]
TDWSGCYFYLVDYQAGDEYVIEVPEGSPAIGAYLFSTDGAINDALCFPLGMSPTRFAHTAYNFDEYQATLETKLACEEDTTTTATSLSADLTTVVTTQGNTSSEPFDLDVSTTTEEILTSTETGDLNFETTTTETAKSTDNSATDEPTTEAEKSTALVTQVDTTENIAVDSIPTGQPPCRQDRIPYINFTLSTKEIEETKDKIINHLKVETEALSSFKRSKISAPDQRASSTSMGIFGLGFITIILVVVIVSDISKLLLDIKLALANIRYSGRNIDNFSGDST